MWTDYRNGNRRYILQDLSTKKQTRITTDEIDQWEPAIYGDKIVWTGYRDENYDGNNIYMYDISTKKEKMITTDEAFHSSCYLR